MLHIQRGLRLASKSQRRQFGAGRRLAKEVTLTIDGKKVTIEAGTALIQACEKAGVTVPRYCYHEKLMIAGNCRMCLVDLEKAPKPVASCAFPVAEGMVVRTDTERVKKAREGVTEMILGNHPLDCPVCDQGGECDLQDQSMRYGSDRGRFREIAGKRATEDKDIGPLIKTSMNRCIQCTRCVRFANDIAGAPELGTSGRGNDMQIGTYIQQNLKSELSGNVIDLCPVGALTNKPYAFKARPWELKKTETIDVTDALGSNIRVDSRGSAVLRVLPRLNDEINEEWISDKTRFCVDGLNVQRLTTPLIKSQTDGQFHVATWDDALALIQDKVKPANLKPNEFKAVAGDLADVESLTLLRDLTHKLGSENLALDHKQGNSAPAHGVDMRTNYTLNSTIRGFEHADKILLVGTNPRHEAAVLNARLRKNFLANDAFEVGLVGESFDSTFWVEDLGSDANALEKALNGEFGKKLAGAEKPMIVLGSGVIENPDSERIFATVAKFALAHKDKFITDSWTGYSVLQRAASKTGAYEVGFAASADPKVANTIPKVIYLLQADEIQPSDLPADAFVIYQGHHGDVGAQYADVVLPGAAFTEKVATYVNTEGRSQQTRAAVAPPGAAREDWKILRAVSEVMGATLPYETLDEVRERISAIAPNVLSYEELEPVSTVFGQHGLEILAKMQATKTSGSGSVKLTRPIADFYLTDSICRSSPTMAKCSVELQ